MTGVTRFPARAPMIERMHDFTRHLRDNGLCVGLPETRLVLRSLPSFNPMRQEELRMALKAICTADSEGFARFDELFSAYWMNAGRMRTDHQSVSARRLDRNHFTNRSNFLPGQDTGHAGSIDAPDHDNQGESDNSGQGKLVSTEMVNRRKQDMREFLLPEDRKMAERIARRIAAAIRHRRSRRRRAAIKGMMIDFRKVMRHSISRGGEPLWLFRRRRPDRPAHLIAILDVSGSMTLYSRVFLAFLRGLVDVDQRADAFLFHTSLVCISDALKDSDSLRAVNRLSLMARGFGGGTRIGHCLRQFNSQYAKRMVGRRSVVMIMSDGYDTGPAEIVGDALARLKRKGCRLIWLNPLLGWKDYAPVSAGMAAAMPSLDHFAPCNTLESLANLENELGRI